MMRAKAFRRSEIKRPIKIIKRPSLLWCQYVIYCWDFVSLQVSELAASPKQDTSIQTNSKSLKNLKNKFFVLMK